MDARLALPIDLMTRFAERTGLDSDRPSRRYLWTDAFAVCNFLALDRATGERRYLELALRLVEQVHATLGRHRADDTRHGWLSGRTDADAELHPTSGGLRIGKPLPERGPREPFDERVEWDRDGQYFHYLTKWMYALDRVARATGQPMFATWARELAVVAHRAFTYAPRPGAPNRMFWKMSIDLSRPLVASMGHHDPLDGFITCLELERGGSTTDALARARSDFAAMIDPAQLATTDSLGLGELLVAATRLEQIAREPAEHRLVAAMLEATAAGLGRYVEQPERRLPAARRLAFRELGLAIGLAAIEQPVRRQIAALQRFAPLRDEIDAFWCESGHRAVDSWREHADINDVMLATSLLAT